MKRHEDRNLEERDRGRGGRQGQDARSARVEGLGARNRRQDRLAAEQHDPGEDEADRRRDLEEVRRESAACRAAGCAPLRSRGGSRPRPGSASRGRSAPLRADPRRARSRPPRPTMTIPIIRALIDGQSDEGGALVQGDGLARVAPADPGQDRDGGADDDRGDVDRDVERPGRSRPRGSPGCTRRTG